MRVNVSFYILDGGLLTGHTYTGPLEFLSVPEGQGVVDGQYSMSRYKVSQADDGFGGLTPVVVPRIPDKPADTDLIAWSWSEQADNWVSEPTLDGAKDTKWAAIKAARAAAEVAPLTVDGLTFDADPASQQRIAGAVQLATLAPAGWTLDWTLADNTAATLTAAQLVAVSIALGAQVSAAHATARVLRAQIDAATSIYDLNAITWPAP